MIGLAPTVAGDGYWMVGGDGGVFSFGDAQFYGSTGGLRLNSPVLGLCPTPTGRGYWLYARDGGIFSFGDAPFFGSTGGFRLNRPIVAMAARPQGDGYWIVAEDGGVFSFGNAAFHGSGVGLVKSNVVGLLAATGGAGYAMLTSRRRRLHVRRRAVLRQWCRRRERSGRRHRGQAAFLRPRARRARGGRPSRAARSSPSLSPYAQTSTSSSCRYAREAARLLFAADSSRRASGRCTRPSRRPRARCTGPRRRRAPGRRFRDTRRATPTRSRPRDRALRCQSSRARVSVRSFSRTRCAAVLLARLAAPCSYGRPREEPPRTCALSPRRGRPARSRDDANGGAAADAGRDDRGHPATRAGTGPACRGASACRRSRTRRRSRSAAAPRQIVEAPEDRAGQVAQAGHHEAQRAAAPRRSRARARRPCDDRLRDRLRRRRQRRRRPGPRSSSCARSRAARSSRARRVPCSASPRPWKNASRPAFDEP